MNTEDAIRRLRPGSYQRLPFPIISSVALPTANPARCSFSDVLDQRVSDDEFFPPSEGELSDFLNDLCGVRAIDANDHNRQKRRVASMGALHPASLLLYLRGRGWCVYVPEQHSLGKLAVREQSSEQLLEIVEEHMPGNQAAIICLLSDLDLAENYYQDCLPLLFRDAGVLLGHAALVAAAHGLAFRILGRTGTADAESLVPAIRFKALATGLALVGSKSASALQGIDH